MGLWDQILPFDITLDGTNEVGVASQEDLFGVEILNERSGVSIDDALPEMQATFFALDKAISRQLSAVQVRRQLLSIDLPSTAALRLRLLLPPFP